MAPRPRPPSRPAGLVRWIAAALAALALAGAPGCGPYSGSALTPKEIEAHGIVALRAPPERAFKACIEALKALGYEIEVESPDKGLIVTKKRGVPDLSVSTKGPTVTYARRYTLEIRGGGGGTSRITATPAFFENAADISDKNVWDLSSPLGERELWKQLFAKIEQLL